MPGRWPGGNNHGGRKSRQKRCNGGAMRSGIAESRTDGAVPEDLAGCAETLLRANRLGLPVSMAYACCRSREPQ